MFQTDIGTAISPPPGAAAPVTPECPQELLDSGGVCLTKEEKEEVAAALRELRNIHESKAELELTEPIVIVRDWEDRVFINGGEKNPVKMKLRIGEHVDRDLEATLPIRVFYRERPPDPWFRLRIRAQFGVLVPETIHFASTGGDSQFFVDGGIGWDFFHIGPVNLAAYTGARSSGLNAGLDLTKNFGFYGGPVFVYQGLSFSAETGIYFSFN